MSEKKVVYLKKRPAEEESEERQESPPKRYVLKGKNPAPAKRIAPKGSSGQRPFSTKRFDTPADAFPRFEHDGAHLQVSAPDVAPQTISLAENETLIGREPFCAVCLELPNISRVHASIRKNGDQYTIEDTNSTNGTYVNGVRVTRCVLHHGDQIRIGQAKMKFAQR